MRIEGAAALVTGAGSGLGAATARMLADAGARVAVMDQDAEAARRVADEVRGHAAVADVAHAQDAAAAIDAATAALGPLRILVNCAGIAPGARLAGRDGPHDFDLFEKVIRVNLIGTFNTMRLVADALSRAEPLADGERGVIVNTASIAAFEGQVGQAAYAASKGGVASLCLPAAREFAGLAIRVVTIAPGTFETPMLAGLPDDVRARLAEAVPNPARLGRPEEFAAAVRFAVENGYLNGETIRLDGALRMAPR